MKDQTGVALWAGRGRPTFPRMFPGPASVPVVMPNSAALWGAWRWGESDWGQPAGICHKVGQSQGPSLSPCLPVPPRFHPCWPLTVCSSLVLQHLEA